MNKKEIQKNIRLLKREFKDSGINYITHKGTHFNMEIRLRIGNDTIYSSYNFSNNFIEMIKTNKEMVEEYKTEISLSLERNIVKHYMKITPKKKLIQMIKESKTK